MDLVAFRVLRIRVTIKPGLNLTTEVWKYFREDNNHLRSVTLDLEKINAYFGVCWKVNPHELQSFKYALDPQTLVGTGHGAIPVWVYAIMPRNFAMARRLSGSRSKMGIKAYPPDTFLGNQKFQE